MPAMMLLKTVPDQVVNEGGVFKPLDLNAFIQIQNPNAAVRFQAGLSDSRPLPQGLICTLEGVLSGIAGKGTEGSYEIVIKAEDIEGEVVTTTFRLVINAANVVQQTSLLRDLKTQVWEAVGKDQEIPGLPDLGEMLNWPVTPFDVYFLLERFAYLTIWDAYNPDAPGSLKALSLKGVSKEFNVYDRGSCIVGAPKDLYSQIRTPQDALITARAMAEEVYNRGWTIEFSGFDKMVRAAWVKLQILGAQKGKQVEILHYVAPPADAVVYNKEMSALQEKKPAAPSGGG